ASVAEIAPAAEIAAEAPAVPARGATPAEALPPTVSAPVPARAVPAVVVPAMTPAAPDELHIVDDAEFVGGRAHSIRCAHRRPCGSTCHCAGAYGQRGDHRNCQSVHVPLLEMALTATPRGADSFTRGTRKAPRHNCGG